MSQPKADIFLNLITNKLTDYDNFLSQGFDPDLRSKEEYEKNDKVKELFTKNGKFDSKSFTEAYNTAKTYYDDLAEHDYDVRRVNQFITESPYTPGVKPTSRATNLRLQANPLEQSMSMVGFNKLSDPTITVAEKAQKNNYIWDSVNNKKIIINEDSDDFLTGLVDWWKIKEPSVLAVWDNDGEHVDPVTGNNTYHKKGDYRLDEKGNPFYETLGGRDVTGKEFLKFTDVFTDEGSWFNKYDYMDSDGISKSVLGQTLKTLTTLAPLAIPYVNGAYIATYGGAQVIDFLAEYGKTADSFFNNTDRDDQKTLNNLQGYIESYRQNSSLEGKENPFGFESLTNMASSVFLDIYSQLGVAKLPAKLKAFSNPATLTKSLKQKGFVDRALELDKVLSKPELLKEALGVQQYNQLMNVGKNASFIYNVGLATKEIADVADSIGMDSKDKGIFTLLGAAGLASIYKFLPYDTWFFNGLGIDEQGKMIRGALRKAVEPLKKAYQSGEMVDVKGVVNKFVNNVKSIAKESIEAKTYVGAGLSEAAEESTEVIFGEGMQAMYNTMKELGYTTGKDPDKKFDILGKDFFNELALSAIGGALGGAGFRALNRMPEMEIPEIEQLVQAGYTDLINKTIDKEWEKSNLLSNKYNLNVETEANNRPVWSAAKKGDYTHNDLARDYLKKQVEIIDFAFRTIGADNESVKQVQEKVFEGLGASELFKNNPELARFAFINESQNVGNFTSIRDDALGYAQRIRTKQKEIREIQSDLDAEENEVIRKGKQQTLETKQKELSKLQEELNEFGKIIRDEESDKREYYFKQALFSTFTPLLKGFGVKTREDFNSSEEYENYLFETDKEGRNRAGDVKKAFEEYDKYQKNEDFAKTLKTLNVEQAIKDVHFQDFLNELESVNYDVTQLGRENVFSESINKIVEENPDNYEEEVIKQLQNFTPKSNIKIEVTSDLEQKIIDSEEFLLDAKEDLILDNFVEGQRSLLNTIPQIEKLISKSKDLTISEIKAEINKLKANKEVNEQLQELASNNPLSQVIDPDFGPVPAGIKLTTNPKFKADSKVLDEINTESKLLEDYKNEFDSFKYKLAQLEFEPSTEIPKLEKVFERSGIQKFINTLKNDSKKGLEFVDETGTITSQINQRLEMLNKHLSHTLAIASFNPVINAVRPLLNVSESLRNKKDLEFEPVKISEGLINPSQVIYGQIENYRKQLLKYKRILDNNKKYRVQNIIKQAPKHFSTQLEIIKPYIDLEDYEKVNSLINTKGEVTPELLSDMYLELFKLFNKLKGQTLDIKIKSSEELTYGYKEKDGKITYDNGLKLMFANLVTTDLSKFYIKLFNSIEKGNTAPIYTQELALIDFLATINTFETKDSNKIKLSNYAFLDAPGGAGKSKVVFPNLVTLANQEGLDVYYSAPKSTQVDILTESLSDFYNAQSLGIIPELFKTLKIDYVNPKLDYDKYVEYEGNKIKGQLIGAYGNVVSPIFKMNALEEAVNNADIPEKYHNSLIIIDEGTHLDLANLYVLQKALEKVGTRLRVMGGSEQKSVTGLTTVEVNGVNKDITISLNADPEIAEYRPTIKLQDTLRNSSQYASETNDSIKELIEKSREGQDNDTLSELSYEPIPNRYWEGEYDGKPSIFGTVVTDDKQTFDNTIKKFLKAKQEGETIVFITDNTTLSDQQLIDKFGTSDIRVVAKQDLSSELETIDTIQGGEWDYVVVDTIEATVGELSGFEELKDVYTLLTRAKKAVTLLNPNNIHGSFSLKFAELERDISDSPALKVVMNEENIKSLRDHKLQTFTLLKQKLENLGFDTSFEDKTKKEKLVKGKPKGKAVDIFSPGKDTVSAYTQFKRSKEIEELKAIFPDVNLPDFYLTQIEQLGTPESEIKNLRVKVYHNLETVNIEGKNKATVPLVIYLEGDYNGIPITVAALNVYKDKGNKFTPTDIPQQEIKLNDEDIQLIASKLKDNLHFSYKIFNATENKYISLNEFKEKHSNLQFTKPFYIKSGEKAGQIIVIAYIGGKEIVIGDKSYDINSESAIEYLYQEYLDHLEDDSRPSRSAVITLAIQKYTLSDILDMFKKVTVDDIEIDPNKTYTDAQFSKVTGYVNQYLKKFKKPLFDFIEEASDQEPEFINQLKARGKFPKLINKILKAKNDLENATTQKQVGQAFASLSGMNMLNMIDYLNSVITTAPEGSVFSNVKPLFEEFLEHYEEIQPEGNRIRKDIRRAKNERFSDIIFPINNTENLELNINTLSLQTVIPKSIYNKINMNVNTTPEPVQTPSSNLEPTTEEQLIADINNSLISKGLTGYGNVVNEMIKEVIKGNNAKFNELLGANPKIAKIVIEEVNKNCKS